MKDSADEILAKYEQNPSRENMKQIAKDNGCSLEDVGNYLKSAAENRKNTRSETNSKPKRGRKPKSGSAEVKMRPKTYLIPPIIETVALEKINEYTKMAQIHLDKAKELQLQANELQDFLDGGFYNGKKDELFRQV